jgi:hypothetical protein
VISKGDDQDPPLVGRAVFLALGIMEPGIDEGDDGSGIVAGWTEFVVAPSTGRDRNLPGVVDRGSERCSVHRLTSG